MSGPPYPSGFAPLDPATDRESCDVCGAPPPLAPYRAASIAGVFDAWVCRCASCGFRQVRPRLDDAEVARLYPDDYFDESSDFGFFEYARQQQRYSREAYFLARRLTRRGSHGRLLEVGCALGFLLDALRRRSGWQATGLDIAPFAATFAREVFDLDVHTGTLDQAAFEERSFDLVIQQDLLEHVSRPRDHLEETRRILAPNGRLFLVTPNGDADLEPLARLAAKLRDQGDDASLPMLHQGHLSFFRRAHLLRLLADAGLQVESLRSIRVRRGLRSLGWWPSRRERGFVAPAGRARTGAAGSKGDGVSTAAAAERIESIRSQLAARRSALRESPAYFWWRRLQTRLDTLPGVFPVGHDYEIVARRVR